MNLKASFSNLKPNVFFMGVVSFFTDVSSEMIFPLLPLFLTDVLGAKTVIVGLVEGVGDSTATLVRIPSGALSDKIRKRKVLTVWGHSISTMAKPFMYFATRDTYHFLVLVAVAPAVLAVVVLLLRVKERTPLQREEATSSPRAGRFPREFKLFIVIMVLFTLGNSSDAFLVLRAHDLGFFHSGCSYASSPIQPDLCFELLAPGDAFR